MELQTTITSQMQQAQAQLHACIRSGEPAEDALWNCLAAYSGFSFFTAKKLPYTYWIRGSEMFVTRREKSITRATVELALKKVLSLNGQVPGPKTIGCFGASYLYPVFCQIGLIQSQPKQ